MYRSSDFLEHFFTFSNPFFLGLVLTILIVIICIFIVIKIILPYHKEYVTKGQRYLLEKAELMALFSELDPDPLVRINKNGIIIQTNEASRKAFGFNESEEVHISKIIKEFELLGGMRKNNYVLTVNESVYTVHIMPGKNLDYCNIYFHDITKLKKYEASLEDYRNKLKIISEKLDAENDNIKSFISYELHDDICQQLVALRYEAASLGAGSEDLIKSINRIHSRVRDLSKELKPADLDNIGLRISVQILVDSIKKRSGMEGEYEYIGKDEKLNGNLENNIYRVIQEALNNIVKHSKAKEFSVKLQVSSKTINLYINDDGIGIPPEYFNPKNYQNYGIGLLNIREKIERLKGTVRIVSNEESGTMLIINIPLKETENEKS